MKRCLHQSGEKGFTLTELMVAVVIAGMLLSVLLAISSHVQGAAASIEKSLNEFELIQEVLQLIEEDLSTKIDPKAGTILTVFNRMEDGYSTALIKLTTVIKDKKQQNQVLEEIVWQANVDIQTNRLVLYRSHTGLLVEDKLLDRDRDEVETLYPFVPVCGGLTAFHVEIRQGEDWTDFWSDSDSLPNGIRITLSDAQAEKNVQGEWEVPEEDLVTRTIAIDRTRVLKFEVADPNANAIGIPF